MKFKTIVIVVLTVLVTVILMKNTDEIDFWIFGDARIPKLAMMGAMFLCGCIVGYLLSRPSKKLQPEGEKEAEPSQLSDEDREFIQ